MNWADLFKLFTYVYGQTPSEQRRNQNTFGAGVSTPDVISSLRQDGSFWNNNAKGFIRLRDSDDFIDLSSITSRQMRYKEYHRLISVPEINSCLTIMAQETCLAGDTKVATPYLGLVTLEWLANNKADEEFFVYCWDFENNDYTIGTAYNPRKTKREKTFKVILNDGTNFIATADHKILKSDKTWIRVDELKIGENLTPFYRVSPNEFLNKEQNNQFPRVFTFKDGWKTERRFINEWRTGRTLVSYDKIDEIKKLVGEGYTLKQLEKAFQTDHHKIRAELIKDGIPFMELASLYNKPKERRVLSIIPHKEIDVYDLSVAHHENFCGESIVFHNCQIGENNHCFEIITKNEEIKNELNFLFFHRSRLNIDMRAYSDIKNALQMGDHFYEIEIDPSNISEGIVGIKSLPADSMYRIETTKGQVVEYQQSPDGPDYDVLQKLPMNSNSLDFNSPENLMSKAIRFSPNQIVHIKIGEDRKLFYPYGVSIIEAARGPAHQLRLMEDSMVVYRTSRAAERRIFYIDAGKVPPHKVEAFMSRIKDQLRKHKVGNRNYYDNSGAAGVEERWFMPSVDEDIFIPIRPNSSTRIDTLPGATGLSEVDDVLYWRVKLFTSLNFPKNYFSNEDPQSSRTTLSSQNSNFAAMIGRFQQAYENGMWEIADRHLRLRGIPQEEYEDLIIKMTPINHYLELSYAETLSNRINNANSLKSSGLFSDYDILTTIFKYSESKAREIMSRAKVQQLEQARLQVILSNPEMFGIGIPSDEENSTQIGTDEMGPNPQLGDELSGNENEFSGSDLSQSDGNEEKLSLNPPQSQSNEMNTEMLPEPSDDDIRKYDLEIRNYAQEEDREEIDFSEI